MDTQQENLLIQRNADLEKKLAAINRELEIEAALEKVRARAMAMQKSNELTDVAVILFKQVNELGIKTWTTGFNVWSDDNNSYEDYITSPSGGFIEPYTVYTEMAEALTDFSNARKSGVEFDVQYVEGEKLKQLYRTLTKVDEKQYEIMLQDGVQFPSHQYEHFVFGSKVSLMFITYEPVPEAHDIFKRLGKVFEQTYTRFLDLQKAEAAARESQIQLALERVRARTMAMQKSEELTDVAEVMFQQVAGLDIKAWTTGFNVWSDDNNYYTDYITSPQGGFIEPYTINATRFPAFTEISDARKRGEEFYVSCLEGEMLKQTYLELAKCGDKKQYEKMLEGGFQFPSRQLNHFVFGSKVSLMFITYDPVPEAHDIFKRFGKVFEQTYTRFLDLQKAEAQSRENQIQLALERVRARTMAMQHSEELQNTALLLFKQVKSLGIPPFACGFNIWDEDKKAATAWMAQEDLFQPPFKTSGSEDVFIKIFEAANRGASLFVEEQGGEKLEMHYKYMASIPVFRDIIEKMSQVGLSVPTFQIIHCAFFSHGYLMFITYEPVPEAHDIFKRFAKVFEQTYTRFLDLQKAEAQAREAQIEAALERVRARTMAMQKSEDLKAVVNVFYEQLRVLDFQRGAAAINIMDAVTGDIDCWAEGYADGYELPERYHLPYFDHPAHKQQLEHWKKGNAFATIEVSGQEKKSYDEYCFFHTDFAKAPDNTKQLMMQQEAILFSMAYMQYGALCWSPTAITEEQSTILQRFAKVFEQTYTRFLDLQKAEAQARESHIQLALERVRARTMAMQKSDELAEAAGLLFRQVNDLGIKVWTTGFNVWSKDNNSYVDYVTSPQGGFMAPYTVDMTHYETLIAISDARKRGEEFYVQSLEGEKLEGLYQQLSKFGDRKQFEKLLESGFRFPSQQTNHLVFGSEVSLMFITYEPVPEAHDIFKRFGKVFEQTYTRFLDLQRAEAQAKEARIEAALEKVRSRSLAMHKSDELKDVVAILFQKLKELGLVFDGGAAIHLFTEGSKDAVILVASPELTSPILNKLPYDENAFQNNPIINDVWTAKETGKHILNKHYSFEEKNRYFNYVFMYNNETILPEPVRKFILQADSYTASFIVEKNSLLGASSWTGQSFSGNDLAVLKRMARVFEQAYIRFLDLQKSEAQSRESQIQLALERVRARTMAMQHSGELADVSELLFKQVSDLGIKTWATGFNIWSDDNNSYEDWITSPRGGIIEPYTVDATKFPAFVELSNARKSGEQFYVQYLDGERLRQTYQELLKFGNKQQFEKLPEDGFQFPMSQYLHLVFGSKVSLMFITYESVPEAHDIFKRFGRVFEQTYTRFLDLQRAEAQAVRAEQDLVEIKAARKKAEDTLAALKATQQQLIQAEKMASLGELTAGIAHEIQNPLNFVNNFSDVNQELLEELKDEADKGNIDEVKLIANDIKENEQKINHHGKRADTIVKGMLQHSRQISGKKELTDINALCDEYLRLTYHGLRAKEKSFNATMQTDFDKSIGVINVIPQDIGRVLLNVITNAFYAVAEKKKQQPEGYQPTVSLSTKAVKPPSGGLGVLISVKDNGNGIPQKVVDKIFQPFFTTKPAGQGTGLGLSLSYDIIKAHGGEIKVKSNESEGARFILWLPLN